jgi:hypothetical protein
MAKLGVAGCLALIDAKVNPSTPLMTPIHQYRFA